MATFYRSLSRALLGAWAALGFFVGSTLAAASPVAPEDAEFFESKVRPLLVERCYECHSARAEKLKGGLRLDTWEGVRKGGASGPVIAPGDPGASLLVRVIKGPEKDLDRMPAGKAPLSPAEVGVLEDWVRRGAPDPRSGETGAATGKPAAHWAFQPPKAPALPAMTPLGPTRNPIDLFIQARLAAHGLRPSPPADRHTLLRRASFDLTGLPPTPEAMQAFLSDDSPQAFDHAVNALLASPRYGERWARHWLDVARYADSKGYVFEQERRFSHSFTYRDWVVNALNRDLPYDQFVLQQIAGDQLATPQDPWPMAAQGFLTLGRRFLDNQTDIIDDRIDVVFRGLQALTVGCARCHDHKFDPIPTADYYSLYGVFESSEEPAVKPLLSANPDARLAAEFQAELARRQHDLDEFRAERTQEMTGRLRDRFGEYLSAATAARGLDWTSLESLARTRSLDPGLTAAWRDLADAWSKGGDRRFIPWFELAALPTNGFAAAAAASLARGFPGGPGANPLVVAALRRSPPQSLADVAAVYGELVSATSRGWTNYLNEARELGLPAPARLPDPDLEALRQVVDAPNSPLVSVQHDIDRFFDTPTGQKLRSLRRKIEELEATDAGAPWRAMALVDKASPVEPVVFKRGNPGNHGPKVPRQMLEVVAGAGRKAFARGSGRLELAQAIASRSNPLTARVIVNRVWNWHFGAPLVRTPSDFGLRSDPPLNPELLDYLAVWFMDHGWSLKALHREILGSATYQQASDPAADPVVRQTFAANEKADPANTWLWRMNRQRLDFEALRDSLLATSGELDGRVGGQPAPMYEEESSSPRRALYGFIDRQNLPGTLRAFDFASPDSSAPQRFQTTSPQQALYLLNSPFMADRARAFARRASSAGGPARARLETLFQLAFQRPPSARESQLALDFLTQPQPPPPEPPAAAAWSYGSGRFNPAAGRVEGWTSLPHFADNAWQWEAKLPSSKGLWTTLNARGGHPGHTAGDAAIRRWTAPLNGVFSVSGKLEHPSENGDGVRGRIVSSRSGQLGSWDVFHGKKEAKVALVELRRGDTLDFVVEPKADENSDGFQWAPSISLLDATDPGADPAVREWKAERDFHGPMIQPRPLNLWEELAQALLAANEFAFAE